MYTVVLMAALTTSVDLPDRRGGGGCCGCYGGGGHGRRGGGCYGGGCYGGGYGGCYGGGGYGGCYGGGWGGGCMGMGYGGGCMGMGSGGCYGGGYGYAGGTIIQGATIQSGAGGEKLTTPPKQRKNDESMAPAPATIIVDLPADAKLLIDNEATASSGSSRVFQSPTLNPGREYHYTLLAEVVRDGKTVKAEQVVTIKPGEITPVKLTLPATGVAQR